MSKIYGLIKDNVITYVGITNQKLHIRVGQHKYVGKDFDTYVLLEVTEDPTREEYWVGWFNTFINGLNCDSKGLGKPSKQILVWNDEGFVKTYDSCSIAADELNLDQSTLSKVARGLENKTKGFKAEYI